MKNVVVRLVFSYSLLWIAVPHHTFAQGTPPYQHYRYSEFQSATVKLKDGTTTETSLNYNLITEQIILDLGHTKIPYPQTDLVDEVHFGDVVLIPADKFFLELLEIGTVSLLVRRSQKVTQIGQDTGYGTTSQTSTSLTPGGLHQTDYIYQHNLPDDYSTEDRNQYYLKRHEDIHEVKSLKKACKFIPELEKELMDFAKSHRIKIEREEDMRKWVRYSNDNLP